MFKTQLKKDILSLFLTYISFLSLGYNYWLLQYQPVWDKAVLKQVTFLSGLPRMSQPPEVQPPNVQTEPIYNVYVKSVYNIEDPILFYIFQSSQR